MPLYCTYTTSKIITSADPANFYFFINFFRAHLISVNCQPSTVNLLYSPIGSSQMPPLSGTGEKAYICASRVGPAGPNTGRV